MKGNHPFAPSLIDYYSLFTTFFIIGTFGWFFETLIVYALQGQVSERGLLFVYERIGSYFPFLERIPILNQIRLIWGLPIIVIYGLGGCIVSLALKRIESVILVFICGSILMTLFELGSSYFCEYFLHASYWDYSNEALNFRGRICLRASLAWGVVSILAIKALIPMGYSIYVMEQRLMHHKIVYNVLIAYTAVCILYKNLLR